MFFSKLKNQNVTERDKKWASSNKSENRGEFLTPFVKETQITNIRTERWNNDWCFCFFSLNRSTKRNSRIQRQRIQFVFNCGRWSLHGGSGEVCWLIIKPTLSCCTYPTCHFWNYRDVRILTYNFRLPQLVGVCHRRRVHPAAVPVVPWMQQTVCRHKTRQRTKSHGVPNLPLLSQLL